MPRVFSVRSGSLPPAARCGPAAVIHAKGLNSSGATMDPCTVPAAYSASQNSRGGSSG